MGTTKMSLRFFTIAIVLCLLMALPAAARDFEVFGNQISFTPAGKAPGYDLVVTGPGDYYYKAGVDGVGSITWTAVDDNGPLPDGTYTWELRSRAAERVRGAADLAASKIGADASSGTLTLEGGRFVSPDAPEGGITKDIQHLDDVIISFSLCVGNDCVNGESFGFDTVRLKENNLRLHFQDTSTSASFPSNDWRIVINDSSNGGGNYFAVEDSSAGRQPFRVDAGAPANALRVDSGGDVGFGTATPVVDAHIVSGNTPTLRLEQNGSSGFTAQTWDVAGNEANFFVRDATNGSALSFRIEPGADQDSLFIEDTNDIGMGTNNPERQLHIRRASSGANILIEGTGAGIFLESTAAPADERVVQTFVSSTGVWQTRGLNDALSPTSTGIALDLSSGAVGINTSSPNAAAAIDVNGEIWQRGIQLHADYVFEESYELESIEDHAAFMWENKRLPAVPGRTVDSDGQEVLQVGSHRRGMLEELEKAHVYIAELNEDLKDRDQVISELTERLERLEKLVSDQ